jgi:hypothetical protein
MPLKAQKRHELVPRLKIEFNARKETQEGRKDKNAAYGFHHQQEINDQNMFKNALFPP